MTSNVHAIGGGRALIAFSTPMHAAESGVETWITLSYIGKWLGHPAGKFEATRELLEREAARLNATRAKLMVDYNHLSLLDASQTPDPIEAQKAAGWVTQFKVDGDRLVGLFEPTDRARASIEAREWGYISPVWLLTSKDPVTGQNVEPRLHNVALTNTPFFTDQDAIKLAASVAPMKGSIMNEQLEQLAKDFGVADGAALIAMLTENKSKIMDALKPVEASADPKTDTATLAASVRLGVLEGEMSSLRKENEMLKASAARSAAETLVDTMLNDGRAEAKERQVLIDLKLENGKLFDALTASRTPNSRVPMVSASRRSGASGTSTQTSTAGLSEVQKQKFDGLVGAGFSQERALERVKKED